MYPYPHYISVCLHSRSEVHLFGEHGHNTGDLLLGMEARHAGSRLEVQRHLVVDAGQDLHELQLWAVFTQQLAEGLHEPRTSLRVPPRVVTYSTHKPVCD